MYCTVAGGLAYGFIGVQYAYTSGRWRLKHGLKVSSQNTEARTSRLRVPLHQPIGPLLPSSLGGKPASPTSLCLRTRTAIARCTALPIAPHLVSSVIS